MAANRFAKRRSKLIRQIKKSGGDGLLVTCFTNVSYLTGFTGDDSYLFISPTATVLISDSRYSTQISEECPDLDACIRSPGQTMSATVSKVVKKAKATCIGFESHLTSYDLWTSFCDGVKSAEWLPMPGLVEGLREIKDKQEVTEIQEAITQAERAFHSVKSALTGGMTELQVAHQIEHTIRHLGGAGVSFPPIVAVGPRAALPHARPTEGLISEAGFVLVDWGATNARGYRSDLTRLITTDKISTKLDKIYRVVLNAQRQGIAAIRPGIPCCEVDAKARAVIEDAGFGKRFGHGLGHGIGLDIHEAPRLGPISQTILKPGMVVTVEPGIYIPGWGGVRIEDDVLVTPDGCQILTAISRELEDSSIE